MRQRSSQRLWDADITFRRQEPLADVSVLSQASSSFKEINIDEEARSEQRAYTSSVHTDGSDGDEKGEPQLAEHVMHRLSDAPSTPDLSFLFDYNQHTNEQHDDLCTCAILPFPFCSSSIHYKRPHPLSRSALRAPQALLTPPASGDNTPHRIPLNEQIQDSCFEMDTMDTESLDMSALTSTMYWSQSSFEKTCQCAAGIILALEKLETSCNSGSRAGLDSIVANQKDTVRLCHSMLKCISCMAKRENLVLLVFMIERIVMTCGRIVTLYQMEDSAIPTSATPPSHLQCLSTDHLANNVVIDNQGLITSASTPSKTSSGWQELLLGDYEINSALEWDHLVHALINLQLRAVKELLRDVKSMGNMILGDVQTESLTRAEATIRRLEQDMYII